MRILHVIPSLASRGGGPAKAVIEMCRELLRRGEDVEIYTTDSDIDGRLEVPLGRAVSVRGVSVTYFKASLNNYYKISLSIAAALKSTLPRYDLVHINSLYQFSSTMAACYCRRYGIPYIIRPHGTLDPYLYRRHRFRKSVYELLIERRNLAAAAMVHFTSVEEMELAQSLGLAFHGTVAPLGLETDETPPGCGEIADAAWPVIKGHKVILFLGRINFKKGLDILAHAFGQIRRHRSDVHLVIAGADNEGLQKEVRSWLTEQGVLDAVTFTGMVVGELKAALLQRAVMFVLPSYSENFGIAVVEAMSAGLPVVISNKVNIWSDIETAGAGLVVNIDAVELAAAMERLLDDPRLAAEMGARGERLVREQFSWRVAGDRLLKMYQDVLSSRRSQVSFTMTAKE